MRGVTRKHSEPSAAGVRRWPVVLAVILLLIVVVQAVSLVITAAPFWQTPGLALALGLVAALLGSALWSGTPKHHIPTQLPMRLWYLILAAAVILTLLPWALLVYTDLLTGLSLAFSFTPVGLVICVAALVLLADWSWRYELAIGMIAVGLALNLAILLLPTA